jgi:hypothetical protein
MTHQVQFALIVIMVHRMLDGYPETCPPEIKLVKKKGLTTGQVQTINDRLQKKAQELIGTEMIFDLVDEAKVLQLR